MADQRMQLPDIEIPPVGPPLTAPEREQIRGNLELSAPVIHEVIREFGESQLRRPPQALFWSGLAAGLSVSFSLVGQGLLRAFLPRAIWSPLVFRLGFSLGFLIVTLGPQQLFTEDTITAIIPLLTTPTLSKLGRVLRLWGIVVAANLLGTLAFAWVMSATVAFDPVVRESFAAISRETVSIGFGGVLLRAVFSGWLIALMVWLLPPAGSARVAIIVIITYVVALGRLFHSISGSTEGLFLVFTGAATVGQYLRFVVAALLGNAIGGVVLGALLNHAQVVAGWPLADRQRRS